MKALNGGERALLAAILSQAIEDIRIEKPKYVPLTKEEHKKKRIKKSFEDATALRQSRYRDSCRKWVYTREAALSWIKSDNRDLCSFMSICLCLDLDPYVVRKKLGME